ncbi:MAG: hypothetical protein WEC54_06555, partial [Gemmatimonadales bacterium]
MKRRFLLLHPPGFDATPVAAALETERIAIGQAESPLLLRPEEVPTAFVLTPGARAQFAVGDLRRFVGEGGAVLVLGAEGEADLPETYTADAVAAYVPYPWQPRTL